MSMTREEASVLLKMMFAFWANTHERTNAEMEMALNLALSALRPVSREQVEKVWKGELIGNDGEKVGTIDGVPIKSATCSSCGHWLTASDEYDCEGHFCPACGKAMTDEAVDMVMERLEALHENRD